MFNRSEIFTQAWSTFRFMRDRVRVAITFADALKDAWAKAKAAAAKIARAARIEAAADGPNGARVVTLLSAIERLQYADWKVDTEARRARYEAELSQLVA